MRYIKSLLWPFMSCLCSVATAQPRTIPTGNVVDVLYKNILKHAPDKGGMDFYVSLINECKVNNGIRDIVLPILSSEEYKTIHFYNPLLEYAYKVILERSPENEGAQFYIKLLEKKGNVFEIGGTTKEVYRYMLHSEEFEKKYAKTLTPAELNTKLCLIILGRSPQSDPTLNYLQNEIATKGYRSAVNGLLDSREFADRFGKLGLFGNQDIISNYINSVFQDLLQHSPAPGEYFNVVQKRGLDDVIKAVLFSPEYTSRFGDWFVPGNPIMYRLATPPCRQTAPPATQEPSLSVLGTMLNVQNGQLYYRPTDSAGNCTLNLAHISTSKVISKTIIGQCTLQSEQSGSVTRDLYQITYKP